MGHEIEFPLVESHLPEFMDFVTMLTNDYEAGEIDSQQVIANRVQVFFNSDMIDKVDVVVPGWRKMSS